MFILDVVKLPPSTRKLITSHRDGERIDYLSAGLERIHTGVVGIFIPIIHKCLFLIAGYFKEEEVREGQHSASLRNVLCFETIKASARLADPPLLPNLP